MENFNLIVSIFSIVLSGLAIYLCLHFYDKSKQTEKETSNSLIKIDTQTDMLQELTGKWMDKLTGYATRNKPNPLELPFQQLLKIIPQLPKDITKNMDQENITKEQLNQLRTLGIFFYFYCAQTNIWSQQSLPNVANFNKNDPNHNYISTIINVSHRDFKSITKQFSKIDQKELKQLPMYYLYNDTKNHFSNFVMSTEEIFLKST